MRKYVGIDHETQEKCNVTLKGQCLTLNHIEELEFSLFKDTACTSQHFGIVEDYFEEGGLLVAIISPEILAH